MNHHIVFFELIHNQRYDWNRALGLKYLMSHPASFARYAVGEIITSIRDEIDGAVYDS